MVDAFRMDTSSFPKEMNFILWLLQEDENTELDHILIETMCREIDWDWNRFLFLAKHHRVFPTIYSKWSKLDRKHIPDEIFSLLQHEYRENTFSMLHLYGEMEQVCQSFNKQGVRSLMLKGPLLAEVLYGDISRRTSKDLDILIAYYDLHKVEQILIALGYEPDDTHILNSRKRKSHHISYTHVESNVQIEVHWQLNTYSVNEPTFEELWERRRTSMRLNFPIYFLSQEDLFFHLVTHGARHGWFRVRWLVDIDRMVRQGLDWNRLLPFMNKHKAHYLCGQTLILISELLKTPISNEMKLIMNTTQSRKLAHSALRIINDIVYLNNEPSSGDVDTHFRGYMMSIKSFREKKNYIVSLMYPSTLDATMLPLPKLLHFLYFPLRPILWVLRQRKTQQWQIGEKRIYERDSRSS